MVVTMENAEQFGAESRFSKLQNKVAKQYEEDGYTKEEAMKIGGAVAYDSGVKKYGKQGMKNLTTKGIKKAQKRRARKSNSKARTMARKGARRSKALAYGAESYSADFGKPTDGDFTTMQVRIGSSSGSTTSWTTSFNIQCVGDEDNLSYLTSDIEDVVVDRVKRWNGDQFGDFIPMQIVIGSSSGNSGSWYRAFTVKPVGGEDNLSYLASDIEDVVVDRVKRVGMVQKAHIHIVVQRNQGRLIQCLGKTPLHMRHLKDTTLLILCKNTLRLDMV